MSHEKKAIPKSTPEKKQIIADFLEYLNRDDQEILASAKTFAGVIGAIIKVHISNGLVNRLVEKGKGFIAEFKDPRICWHYLKEIKNMPQPALKDLEQALNIRANKLISAVDNKNIPDWFWELLQAPKELPPGYREIFRKKSEDIWTSFSFNVSTSCVVKPANPPGEHPYKKDGQEGHPYRRLT